MPKVSVIIPVYKSEAFIAKCARSLFDQTLDSMEFIFVDDCSPDRSIDILIDVLQEYPRRIQQVSILKLPKNSKQAAARNEGLKYASGEYIIHCDPDDYLDSDLYKKMYFAAKLYNCDIVRCDCMISDPCGKQYVFNHREFTDPMEPLLSKSFFFPSLCLHLIDRKLITTHNLQFYKDINYMEDFGFVVRALYFANKVGHVHNSYYYYNKCNEEAITRRGESPEILVQRQICLELLDQFFISHGETDIQKFGLLMRNKRDIKNIFLKSGNLKKWREIFPEVAQWEFRNAEASLLYRCTYLLSHIVGLWPMRLLLKLHK